MKYISLIILCLSWNLTAFSAQIKTIGKITFQGDIHEPENISAIASFGQWLVIGTDEGTQIQILDLTTNLTYTTRKELVQLCRSETEIDVEGMAAQSNTLFVTGSHSLKRKTVQPEKPAAENHKRIAVITTETSRDNLFRLTFDPDTGLVNPNIENINLKKFLSEDPVLGRFARIPGKENGIDIEGIAADNNTLYIGFRSPVLRGNFVPVMITSFDLSGYRLIYLNLEGNGIRDITKVKDGFLLIAGPPGEGPGDYQIYFWNGLDGIPNNNSTQAELINFGKIPAPKKAKPEGITVIKETPAGYEVIIVYDGAPDGQPTLFALKR